MKCPLYVSYRIFYVTKYVTNISVKHCTHCTTITTIIYIIELKISFVKKENSELHTYVRAFRLLRIHVS